MKEFLKRYWLFILIGVFLVFVVTVYLMIVTSKPQEGGFVYQIN